MFARLASVWVVAVFGLWAALSPIAAGSSDSAKVMLSGQVVGEDDKPVAGATVQPLAWKQPPAALKTDQEGRFSMPTEVNAGGFITQAFLVKAADGRLGYSVIESAKPEPMRIVLKPARTLHVAVKDREGSAVQGAEVLFLSDLRMLETGTTDTSGSITFQVPADCRGWASGDQHAQGCGSG